MSYYELAVRRIRKFYPGLPIGLLIPPEHAVELLVGTGMNSDLAKATVRRMSLAISETRQRLLNVEPPKEPNDAA